VDKLLVYVRKKNLKAERLRILNQNDLVTETPEELSNLNFLTKLKVELMKLK
jgi:hypothetical protein